MPWSQTAASQYHAQVGLTDKSCAVKGLVVCNNCMAVIKPKTQILLLGGGGVGKSCLTVRMLRNTYMVSFIRGAIRFHSLIFCKIYRIKYRIFTVAFLLYLAPTRKNLTLK